MRFLLLQILKILNIFKSTFSKWDLDSTYVPCFSLSAWNIFVQKTGYPDMFCLSLSLLSKIVEILKNLLSGIKFSKYLHFPWCCLSLLRKWHIFKCGMVGYMFFFSVSPLWGYRNPQNQVWNSMLSKSTDGAIDVLSLLNLDDIYSNWRSYPAWSLCLAVSPLQDYQNSQTMTGIQFSKKTNGRLDVLFLFCLPRRHIFKWMR